MIQLQPYQQVLSTKATHWQFDDQNCTRCHKVHCRHPPTNPNLSKWCCLFSATRNLVSFSLNKCQIEFLITFEFHLLSHNTLRPGQNGCNFADSIFKIIILNENCSISIKISLMFHLKAPVDLKTSPELKATSFTYCQLNASPSAHNGLMIESTLWGASD